jgi:hypothetical protein
MPVVGRLDVGEILIAGRVRHVHRALAGHRPGCLLDHAEVVLAFVDEPFLALALVKAVGLAGVLVHALSSFGSVFHADRVKPSASDLLRFLPFCTHKTINACYRVICTHPACEKVGEQHGT